MKKNIGDLEKWIRIVLGLAVIGLGIYFKSWWGLIGIIPLVTGLVNSCPVWSLIGINTTKKIKTEKL